MNDKPWYQRSEFWTAIGGFLQGPLIAMIPGVGPYAQMASAVLSAAAPLLYIHGRGNVKTAQATPPPVQPVIATAEGS